MISLWVIAALGTVDCDYGKKYSCLANWKLWNFFHSNHRFNFYSTTIITV